MQSSSHVVIDSPTTTTPAISPLPVKLDGLECKKKTPTKLADHILTVLKNPYPLATPYPMDNYVSSAQFSKTYLAFLSAITAGTEPKSYKEAVLDENWRFAMKDEITACENNGTWTIEDLPQGKQALGCMWVFRLKFNVDGTLERHKARIVVLGNHQTNCLDYNETFAPVAKMVTVRAFLQQVASLNWEVHQMDVHNAFLHGDLDEEIYMKPPLGFSTNDKSKVLCRRKFLYGLKHAPHCWFEKLGAALDNYVFQQDDSDHSLPTIFGYFRYSFGII